MGALLWQAYMQPQALAACQVYMQDQKHSWEHAGVKVCLLPDRVYRRGQVPKL